MRTRALTTTALLLGAGAAGILLLQPNPSAPSFNEAPEAKPLESRPETLSIAVEGATLHYLVRGAGPAVILVHGSFGELGDWQPQLAGFASRYRVVAYSRRFHPPNTPASVTDEYGMDQQAEDLATLIQRLHAAPAHVVAHSYGAYVTLIMALRHPHLVRSLVLAEPPILSWLSGTAESDSVGRAFAEAALAPARAAFMRGDTVAGVRNFLNGVIGRPGAFDEMPNAVQAGLLRFANEMRAELLTKPETYMTPITCEQVSGLTMPILLLRGASSARLFGLIAARLQSCLTMPDSATIAQTGHAMQANRAAFNAQVLQFLDRH